jgi:hypothetical protein
MQTPTRSRRFEPRWPAALGIIVVIALMALLTSRVRLLPAWFPYVLVAIVLVPMAGVELTRGNRSWLRVERVTTLLFTAVAGVATVAGLGKIIQDIVNGTVQISGTQLLASAISAWVTNVLVFALLFWQIDGGSPELRLIEGAHLPDWRFPQKDAPPEDVRPGWCPGFVDYLFLSFSTATAFSTTEVPPMTSRAKLLMMLEAAVSLVTITAVAARAINVLGS